MKTMTKIGNVEFISEGVVITRKYTAEEEIPVRDYSGFDKYTSSVIDLLYRRMEHCSKGLNEHITDADTIITNQVVVWKGGHFSLPVFEQMAEATENRIKCTNMSATVLMQALKQLYAEKVNAEGDTELLNAICSMIEMVPKRY